MDGELRSVTDHGTRGPRNESGNTTLAALGGVAVGVYSYVAAIDYWRGQPNQMDADRNGIPCETVYSAMTVTAFWFP
jgi:hypothetical protein